MTEPPDHASSLPTAIPVRRRRLPLGWVLPLVGLGVLAYFAYWAYEQKQANVELDVTDASGIKAFQTPVLCRGVEVGTVTEVTLRPTGRGATVKIRLDPAGMPLATRDSDWWILRPEFSLTDISGVESLLAGPSIEYRPGTESVDRRLRFTALGGPPPDAHLSDGLRLYLTAPHRGSVEPGTPLRYRGIPIGRVVSLRLPTDGQKVIFIAEVDRPFAHLVREESVFWHRQRAHANLNSVALGLDGYRIDFPRLNTALEVSIDLASPDKPGPAAAADTVFAVLDEPPKDHDTWTPDLAPEDRAVSLDADPTAADDPTALPDDTAKPEQKTGPLEDLISFINPFD